MPLFYTAVFRSDTVQLLILGVVFALILFKKTKKKEKPNSKNRTACERRSTFNFKNLANRESYNGDTVMPKIYRRSMQKLDRYGQNEIRIAFE